MSPYEQALRDSGKEKKFFCKTDSFVFTDPTLKAVTVNILNKSSCLYLFQSICVCCVSNRSQDHAASRLSTLYVMKVVKTAARLPLGME